MVHILCEKKVSLQHWPTPVYNVYKVFCSLSKTYSALHVPESVQAPSVRSLTNLCLLQIASHEVKPRFFPRSSWKPRLTLIEEHGPCVEIPQTRKLEPYIPPHLRQLYASVCRVLNAVHIIHYLSNDMFRHEKENNDETDAVWRTKFHLRNVRPIDTLTRSNSGLITTFEAKKLVFLKNFQLQGAKFYRDQINF